MIFVKDRYQLILWLTCLVILSVIFRQFYLELNLFPDIYSETSIYYPFGFSDWLINYQGSFIRRGLAGEILWRIYQWHPYSVVYAILCINLVSLVGISTLCFLLFRRMGWPIALLFFPMFLYFPSYGLTGMLGFRRDMLVLLLAFYLFWLYKKYIIGGGYIVDMVSVSDYRIVA